MQPYKVWVFSDLLEKNKRIFKVPVYQRNYDWSHTQCEKLYQDIITAHDKDHKHFTGTVVYIVGIGGSTLNEALIIDGQQRITTVYILLKALYDAAEIKGGSIRLEEEIKEIMFNRNCEEKYKIKLKPIKTDNEQLILLIQNKVDEMDRNSNIYKNYVTFKKLIEASLNEGYELEDILDGIKKLEMVEIVLDKSQGDEPQKIFESINSTGLALSLADLIRNYLLMDDDNQDELYENYWIAIEKNVGYRNLGDFVINYLNSKITKNVNSKNAYDIFKRFCEKEKLSHEDILIDLKKKSKYYGAFTGNINVYNQKISKLLNVFAVIKQTTIYPLLFNIFEDYEEQNISEETLCNVLDYLITYLVRITACETTKNLNKFFRSLYNRVFDGDYKNYYEKFVNFLNNTRTNDRMPNDKEFEYSLMYKPLYTKPICKFVLSLIENSSKEHIDIKELTIEHVLPQKENAAVWVKELGTEYSHVYETYLHTLGNLTITGYNSELGTKPFSEKKKIISENSKANILNKDILSCDKWTEKAIISRAKKLSEILIEKLDYVEISCPNKLTEKMGFSLNSGLDFSDTKPSGFTFLGEYNKASTWIELLSKFLSLVYDLDSDFMNEMAKNNYSIQNSERIYISNDSRCFRRSKEIDHSGIYYEANLSANNILSFVKSLVYELNLEIDEFSFFLEDSGSKQTTLDIIIESSNSVAELFYNLLSDLIDKHQISSSEVSKLKTKEYTKELFQHSDYPALANSRNDNMGNSSQKRYRVQPLLFEEKDLYVSTQFFNEDREDIIGWYQLHK